MQLVEKIVSGGQTGVDRAALEWAIANGIPHGGWCPHGRLAEDGPIEPRFHLEETTSRGYAQRTEWNVRDSDATVIISLDRALSGGSRLTEEFARKWQRPCIRIYKRGLSDATSVLNEFLDQNFVRTLNVAGPRDSTEPNVSEFVFELFNAAYNS